MAQRQVDAGTDEAGLGGEGMAEERVEPIGHGGYPAGGRSAGERLPDAELEQGNRHQQGVGVGEPKGLDTRVLGAAAQMAGGEALFLMGKDGVPAAQDMESGDANDLEPARAQDAGEFSKSERLFTRREVDDDVEREDGIEGILGEG